MSDEREIVEAAPDPTPDLVREWIEGQDRRERIRADLESLGAEEKKLADRMQAIATELCPGVSSGRQRQFVVGGKLVVVTREDIRSSDVTVIT